MYSNTIIPSDPTLYEYDDPTEVQRNPGYWALKFHRDEAYLEKNQVVHSSPCPDIAIFSRKYYNEIKALDKTKKHDYCFIGSMNSAPERREWVLEFVKTRFTENSIFLNTDKPADWVPLGAFDHTNKVMGFCPKDHINNQEKEIQYRQIRENTFYFEAMCQSRFCLCPAGDNKWSFRFYEVLMCESIPIMESGHHIYRTVAEGSINYYYYLYDTPHHYNEAIINHNRYVFETIHLLPP